MLTTLADLKRQHEFSNIHGKTVWTYAYKISQLYYWNKTTCFQQCSSNCIELTLTVWAKQTWLTWTFHAWHKGSTL